MTSSRHPAISESDQPINMQQFWAWVGIPLKSHYKVKVKGGIPDRNLTFHSASLAGPFQRNKNWNVAWTGMQSRPLFQSESWVGAAVGHPKLRGKKKRIARQELHIIKNWKYLGNRTVPSISYTGNWARKQNFIAFPSWLEPCTSDSPAVSLSVSLPPLLPRIPAVSPLICRRTAGQRVS